MTTSSPMTVAQLSGFFPVVAPTHMAGAPVLPVPATTDKLYAYEDRTGTMYVLGDDCRRCSSNGKRITFNPVFLRFGDGALRLADHPVQHLQVDGKDLDFVLVEKGAKTYLNVGPSYGNNVASVGPLRCVQSEEAAQILGSSHVQDELSQLLLSPTGNAMVLRGLLAWFPKTPMWIQRSLQSTIDEISARLGCRPEERAVVESLIERVQRGSVRVRCGGRSEQHVFNEIPLDELRFYLRQLLDNNMKFRIECGFRPHLYFITIGIEKGYPGWEVFFAVNLATLEDHKRMEADDAKRMVNTILAYARHIQENAGDGPIHVNPTWKCADGFKDVEVALPGEQVAAYGLIILHNPQTGRWEINCRKDIVNEIYRVLVESGIPFKVRNEYYR